MLENAAGLTITDLRVRVGEKEVVRGISLEVNPGEVRVLLGPNGAGKSSLLKALAGHGDYGTVGGDIRMEGVSIQNEAPDERARRGLFLAFQYPHELEGVSVANFVRSALKSRLENGAVFSTTAYYERLYNVLERVGLGRDFAGRSLNEGFSGGEKKRMELLQMILLKPRYALMDEIDSGMDADALRLTVETIRELRQETRTGFLIVTHYEQFIEKLNPDKIYTMREGRIVLTGQDEG
jgi:Fe-S cluster assembly ATP-binding protein